MNQTALHRWLDGASLTPADCGLEQWERTGLDILHRLRGLRHEMVKGGSLTLDHMTSWLIAMRDWAAVSDMVEALYPQRDDADYTAYQEKRRAMQKRMQRLVCQAKRLKLSQRIKRWAARQTFNRHDQRCVDEVLYTLTDFLDGESDKLARQHYKAYDKRRTMFKEQGEAWIQLTQADIQVLHPCQVEDAAQQAAQLGRKGYIVEAFSNTADDLFRQSPNRKQRERIWRQKERLLPSYKRIEAMLEARLNEATKGGHNNASEFLMSRFAYNAKQTVERQFGQLRKTYATVRQSVEAYQAQLAQHMNIEQIEPWDSLFSRGHAVNTQNHFRLVFATKKLINLMSAAMGWMVLRGEDMTEDRLKELQVWEWEFEREGQKVSLIFKPYFKERFSDPGNGGMLSMVVDSWSSSASNPHKMQQVLELALYKNQMEVDRQTLAYLCHELGHAFHYMSMPHHLPGLIPEFPDDFIELPSQMMESLVRDPALLAELSEGRVSEETWRQTIRQNTHIEKTRWLKQVKRADLDFSIHADYRSGASAQAMEREILARWSLADLCSSPNLLRETFNWESYASGFYVYPFNFALAESLLIRRGAAKAWAEEVDSHAVLDVFVSMEKYVLGRAYQATQFKQRWQEWTGQTLLSNQEEALREAMESMRSLSVG